MIFAYIKESYKKTLFLGLILVTSNLVNAQKEGLDFKNNIVERKIDSILSLLTLEEKVAMCHAQSKFSTKGVERLGIPEIWLSDGPHGVRAEIKWSPPFTDRKLSI